MTQPHILGFHALSTCVCVCVCLTCTHPLRYSQVPYRVRSPVCEGTAHQHRAEPSASSASCVDPLHTWMSCTPTTETSSSRYTSLECCLLWRERSELLLPDEAKSVECLCRDDSLHFAFNMHNIKWLLFGTGPNKSEQKIRANRIWGWSQFSANLISN